MVSLHSQERKGKAGGDFCDLENTCSISALCCHVGTKPNTAISADFFFERSQSLDFYLNVPDFQVSANELVLQIRCG